MSKKNLRIGVIGAGRIGIVHSGSVNDTAGAELVVVVDATPAKGSYEIYVFAEDHSVFQIYTLNSVVAL